jgi:hypothetical protein
VFFPIFILFLGVRTFEHGDDMSKLKIILGKLAETTALANIPQFKHVPLKMHLKQDKNVERLRASMEKIKKELKGKR